MAGPLPSRSAWRRKAAFFTSALALVVALASWGAYRWAEAGARAAR